MCLLPVTTQMRAAVKGNLCRSHAHSDRKYVAYQRCRSPAALALKGLDFGKRERGPANLDGRTEMANLNSHQKPAFLRRPFPSAAVNLHEKRKSCTTPTYCRLTCRSVPAHRFVDSGPSRSICIFCYYFAWRFFTLTTSGQTASQSYSSGPGPGLTFHLRANVRHDCIPGCPQIFAVASPSPCV